MFKNYYKNDKLKNNKNYYDWRKDNKEYIDNIGKFLDIVDNLEDEKLKKKIIYQHFACENIIQKILKKSK